MWQTWQRGQGWQRDLLDVADVMDDLGLGHIDGSAVGSKMAQLLLAKKIYIFFYPKPQSLEKVFLSTPIVVNFLLFMVHSKQPWQR